MKLYIISTLIVILFIEDSFAFFTNGGPLDVNLFRCMWKKSYSCPHEDINFYMYTRKIRRGRLIDIRHPLSFKAAGFKKHHETAILIHGFNGTEDAKHIMYLKDAYLSRDFNIITVDWNKLTQYPCYLSALSNTKLVAQCTAQLFAHLTYKGSSNNLITCVGHSLGAHICGMLKNHLTSRPYKIIGLDPARPLIEGTASKSYRLTRDDAKHVQIIHTNAGSLGQESITGTVDFCVNGGRIQPYCKGHKLRRNRCSHFLSVCYLANAILKHKEFLGVPCPQGCVDYKKHTFPYISNSVLMRNMHIGQDTPHQLTGSYCVQSEFAANCPFSEAD